MPTPAVYTSSMSTHIYAVCTSSIVSMRTSKGTPLYLLYCYPTLLALLVLHFTCFTGTPLYLLYWYSTLLALLVHKRASCRIEVETNADARCMSESYEHTHI
jgi:hypothetical protein